ncbi:MAG: C39 family peptidase [Desulfomonilia bacterium]|jgi:hypothetical protein
MMRTLLSRSVQIVAVLAILVCCCGCHSGIPPAEGPRGGLLEGVVASLPLCKAGMLYQGNAATKEPVRILADDLQGACTVELVSGSLPDGLSLDASGIISGIAQGPAGMHAFSVRVTRLDDPSISLVQELALKVVVPGKGRQPYGAIIDDPAAFFVHQGPSQCGPTSFYMVFKYLGDHLPGAGPTGVDLAETIPGDGVPVLDRSSKIAAYIRSLPGTSSAGTDWRRLEAAARSLRRGAKAYYPCIQSNPRETADSVKGKAEREAIFDRDLVAFLETGTSVIVHLKRPYGVSGHYLTVIGYDTVSGEVLYLDPNNRALDPRAEGFDPDEADWSRAVERVPRSEFIAGHWYKRPGTLAARWDGKWLGFTHR